MNHVLAQAVRQFADQQTDRVRQAGQSTGTVFATVTTVQAGLAKDGNPRVTVQWGAGTYVVNGYLNPYTPTVGDRVVCAHEGSQLVILGKIIGQP